MSQIAYNAGLTRGSTLRRFLGLVMPYRPSVVSAFGGFLLLGRGGFLLRRGCIFSRNMLKWGCYTVTPPLFCCHSVRQVGIFCSIFSMKIPYPVVGSLTRT